MTRAAPGSVVTSLLAVAVAIPMSAAGCDASVSSICDAFCDCQGCTDTEFNECVKENEQALKTAQKEGCAAQADALLTCVQSELRCVEEEVEISGCDDERDKLFECSGTIIGFGGCELGEKKLEECLGLNPGDVGECTPDVECNLLCVAGATCDEIQNGSIELNDCFSKCSAVEPGGGGTGGAGRGAGGTPPPD